jgi:hypothetical protein
VARRLAPLAALVGLRFAFRLKLPRKVARKYAGRRLRATITVTAKEAAARASRW